MQGFLCLRIHRGRFGHGHGHAEAVQPVRGAPGQADGVAYGDQDSVQEPGQDVPPGRCAIGRPGFHGDPQRLCHAVRSGGQVALRSLPGCPVPGATLRFLRSQSGRILHDPEMGNRSVLVGARIGPPTNIFFLFLFLFSNILFILFLGILGKCKRVTVMWQCRVTL
jgi:hypothetical protein